MPKKQAMADFCHPVAAFKKRLAKDGRRGLTSCGAGVCVSGKQITGTWNNHGDHGEHSAPNALQV
jgi:hypothetical protein